MVGDSGYDILAGRRAGVSTIGCSWGFGDLEELRDACHLAASCYELADILRSLAP
jgi:phosphoglycolate phosphatase